MRSRASASSSAMRMRIGLSGMRCSRSKVGGGVIRNAQRRQHAAGRGRGEGERGGIAVELIEPRFRIGQTDAFAGRRQAGAIVLNGDDEIVAVNSRIDRDFALSGGAAGAVFEGVLDDRLQDEIRNE